MNSLLITHNKLIYRVFSWFYERIRSLLNVSPLLNVTLHYLPLAPITLPSKVEISSVKLNSSIIESRFGFTVCLDRYR
jgi:hypothetical protein